MCKNYSVLEYRNFSSVLSVSDVCADIRALFVAAYECASD